jgi:Lambda phage tail tube protein, TTP
MSSDALTSQGMTISIDQADSPLTYAVIAEVDNIDGPGGSSAEIDVTDLSSTAKEKRLGLPDEGDLTLSLNYIPKNTGHALLRALKASGAVRSYRLTFTDSPPTTWTFDAFVKGFPISNGVDAVTKGNVTLAVSGGITEA